MQVNKTIETPEGTVKFEGELSPTELDLVLSVGLNYLLGKGVISNITIIPPQEDGEPTIQ